MFGLEVFLIGKLYYEAILPSLLAAIIADYVCYAWKVKHTHYAINFVPEFTPIHILYAMLAGIFLALLECFSQEQLIFGMIFLKIHSVSTA